MKTKVSLVKCGSYEQKTVMDAVRRAVDLLGGIRAFVKPGEKILLKPNLLSAKEPERAITTHPEIVRAVIRLVKEAGATPLVGDSPGGAVKGVERVWEKTGMKRIAEEEGVELVNFETAGATEKKIDHPILSSIHLSNAALYADGIINLPKLKTHGFTVYTGAVKNFYGCIPGLRKAEYHKPIPPHTDDFGYLLTEIYLQFKDRVRLNLIDGILGMEGNGPSSGEVRKMDMLLASADAVALDTATTSLLGAAPHKIRTIHCLSKKAAGETTMQRIEIAGDKPSEFALENFKFPPTWFYNFIPRPLVKLLGKFIWLKPVVMTDICTNCQMCVRSCPVQTIKSKGKGGKPEVEPENCISCLCCHELCPSDAIALRSSRLARLVIRQ